MCIEKVKWITALSCGKQKWNSFTSSLRWKGTILGLDIVSQNVPYRKQSTDRTKIADLGIILFSGEVTSYTDTSYCIHPGAAPCVCLGGGGGGQNVSLLLRQHWNAAPALKNFDFKIFQVL